MLGRDPLKEKPVVVDDGGKDLSQNASAQARRMEGFMHKVLEDLMEKERERERPGCFFRGFSARCLWCERPRNGLTFFKRGFVQEGIFLLAVYFTGLSGGNVLFSRSSPVFPWLRSFFSLHFTSLFF